MTPSATTERLMCLPSDQDSTGRTFGEEEIRYVTEVLNSGTLTTTKGKFGKMLEKAFAEKLGAKYAYACTSGSAAIHIAVATVNPNPGDEIITTSITDMGALTPLMYRGVIPVFAEVDPKTLNVTAETVAAKISERTKAIIATHLFGNPCEMAPIMELAKKHNLPVIEDAAEAIGSVYHGKRAGSMGAFGTFSFHGTKTVTTGEGGMFVTNDAALYEHVLTLSNHGRARGQTKQFWPDMIGFKYKMSNIQAAIGCAQMERIDDLIHRKREILSYYRESLKCLAGVLMNPEPEGTINGAWMPTIVFDKSTGITREQLQDIFKSENIDARVFFHPLSSLPMFEDQKVNVNAWDIPLRSINLPSYNDIEAKQQYQIAEILKSQLGITGTSS